MSNRLHVGNLSSATSKAALTTRFGADGRTVANVEIFMGRDGGKARGFAFVEMGTEAEAQAAMAALDQSDFDGSTVRVGVAQPRKSRFGGTVGGKRP